MLTKATIMEAVGRLLGQLRPEWTVCLDCCPADFKRPALLLEAPQIARREVGGGLVEETGYFVITCFGAPGGAGEGLFALRQEIVDLFRTGTLRVEDRAVRASAGEGGMELERAWIELTLTWREAKGPAPPRLPLMGELNLKIEEEETYGTAQG